jgi:hypothetical protein
VGIINDDRVAIKRKRDSDSDDCNDSRPPLKITRRIYYMRQ